MNLQAGRRLFTFGGASALTPIVAHNQACNSSWHFSRFMSIIQNNYASDPDSMALHTDARALYSGSIIWMTVNESEKNDFSCTLIPNSAEVETLFTG